MSNFSDTSVHSMLNAITPDTIKLHSGDPGTAGTSNVISGAQSAATFGAAASRKRVASNVNIANVPANTAVSWYSVFAGATFVTRELIRSKHKTAGTNASGGTVLTIGTATTQHMQPAPFASVPTSTPTPAAPAAPSLAYRPRWFKPMQPTSMCTHPFQSRTAALVM